MSDIKAQLQSDIKTCMKAGDKTRLSTLRLISAAIKQQEVDTREDLDDAKVLVILDKMAKQRRESIEQFAKANREDLLAVEQAELAIIASYLPAALSAEEIDALIEEAVESTGANSMRDMGKVMGLLKPKLQGRADMSAVSQSIKARLQG